jgi:AraC family transcriptional regulator of arabinose operon
MTSFSNSHALRRQFNALLQFSDLFKRHYGTSPMAYFSELRMQRARELLSFTKMSVKEIAAELGFDDPLYFSRAFKKVSGMSPRDYRLKS